MKNFVSIYSFRRGAGKSTLAANLGVLLALKGLRVALVDLDFLEPSLHLFFGLPENEIAQTLNDCIWEGCNFASAACEVTARLKTNARGRLYLIPASTRADDIVHALRSPLDIDRLIGGLEALEKELDLDLLLIDTASGLNADTLPAIAVSSELIIVLRNEPQDYQGTAVTVELAHNLRVPSIYLVLNDGPENINVEAAGLQLENTYHCSVGGVIPHTEGIKACGNQSLFVLDHPLHPVTAQLEALAARL